MNNTVRKGLSLALVLIMLLSQILGAAPFQIGAKAVSGGARAATKTVYYDISGKSWNKVNIYTWSDSGAVCSGDWPGTEMTRLEGSVFYCQVPVDADNVIFNDGYTQTPDMRLPTDGRDIYLSATNSWGKYGQINVCNHKYTGRITTAAGCTTSGVKTYTCDLCGDSYKATIPAAGHKFSGTVCTVCGYSTACQHSYTSVVNRQPTCTSTGVRTYTCSKCGDSYTETIPTSSHSFSGGKCAVCGMMDSSYRPDYYLFGYINGANYGCEGDYQNLGRYKFVNGKLTATFDQDSYVAVKTGDNANWYMTSGWLGTQTTCATLYNSEINGNPDKLFVPGGVQLTFTLVDNGDDSLTLSYVVKECSHSYSSAITRYPTCTTSGEKLCTCDKCGYSYTESVAATGHSFSGGKCTVCGAVDSGYQVDYYLFGYINGGNYACEEDHANVGIYQFVNGKLTATFEQDSYVGIKTADNANWYMTSGWQGEVTSVVLYNTDINANPDKLFVPGGCKITFTLVENGDDTLTLSYVTAGCDHSYTSQITAAATCTSDGVKTYTCSQCGYYYTEIIPAAGHQYVSGKCSVCGQNDPSAAPKDYYLFGFINGGNYACEGDSQNLGIYHFVNGKLTATFDQDSYVGVKTSDNLGWYMTDGWLGTDVTSATLYSTAINANPDKLYVPGGCQVTFTLEANADDTLTLSYTVAACAHRYSSSVTVEATCIADGLMGYTCMLCGDSYTETIHAKGHKYSGGQCSVCGAYDPSVPQVREYYLFGFINGGNYACEEDNENLGIYQFVDGKLTATFETEGYVGVKTGDNEDWFMTNGWQGEVNSATLYNTDINANPDKLYVPGGVELTFTLEVNANGTLTLSYTANTASCSHASHGSDGKCAFCGVSVSHNYINGVCTVCGRVDAGAVADGYYLFGYINGANYACEEDYQTLGRYSFMGGKLTATFQQDSYVAVKTADNANWFMTNGWQGTDTTCVTLYNTNSLGGNADKLYVPGGVRLTFTLQVTSEGTLQLSYADVNCQHTFDSGKVTTAAACGSEGVTTYTCTQCGHFYHETVTAMGHNCAGGKCTLCGAKDPNGCCSNHNYVIDYEIMASCSENGSRVFKAACGAGYSVTLPATGHSYNSRVTTAATCVLPGLKTYTCSCGDTYSEPIDALGHRFENGFCTVCGAEESSGNVTDQSYYLFGFINGMDYGCGDDWENMGEYKFVGDQLTATFETDSYIGIKTGDNASWYMTQSFVSGNSGTFYDTTTGVYEKMLVPGGVSVTFTLVKNADGTLGLSYTTAGAGGSVILPNFTLKYPSLSFKDEVKLNVYFDVTDTDSVVDMGLVVFSAKVDSYTVYNAEDVVSGYQYSSSAGLYSVSTNGIPAKNMGDTVWFAVYAQLSNGTYTYSKLVDYSPRTYAYTMLGSGDAKLDALLVAMLNYGTAAQTYFGYNTGSLLNNQLTSAQKALVTAYSKSMMPDIAAPSAYKQGSFVANGGFEDKYPSVTFGGAFAINYYCVPSYLPSSSVTMYYWREADYNAASVLTAENATGTVKMSGGGTYRASVTGISAKDISDGVYVAFVYSNGTTTYCSGVLPYSIGMYCTTMAGYQNDFTPFAKATAVYGYYAKQYFG